MYPTYSEWWEEDGKELAVETCGLMCPEIYFMFVDSFEEWNNEQQD